MLLVSPIILYDHPAVAPESSVALYDSTEIDEILTLRVLTLTDEEKAEARATDPRAAAIIDRCEAMSPEELQQLHGILRNPHAMDIPEPAQVTGDPGAAWWTPEAEALVQPRPGRRPDQRGSGGPRQPGPGESEPARRRPGPVLRRATGRVTNVHFDVDGSTHVGLVLDQDPAADLHEGYGRSFYYSPERARTPGSGWKGRPAMRIIGMATVTLLAGLALGAIYVGIRSAPDIQRYLKARRM